MLDKNKDERIMEQYQLGNSAQKCLDYFGGWIEKRRERLTREMLASSTQEDALPFWSKLKILEELERDLKRDIQTGELAILEMEEENI